MPQQLTLEQAASPKLVKSVPFALGQTVFTRGVNDQVCDCELFTKFVLQSVGRHAKCDWGDVCEEDWKLNDQALKDGSRLFSVYKKEGLPDIWVITEWDRSVTTVLFPHEY